jgi:hypothetical protein
VLSSIDLADLPANPTIVPMMGADPVSRLARGNWLQMFARDGSTSYAKVADQLRRTVVLVRYPDRRALPLRAPKWSSAFAQGRAGPDWDRPGLDGPPDPTRWVSPGRASAGNVTTWSA